MLLSIVKPIMKKESDNIIYLFDFNRRLFFGVPIKKLTKIVIIRCGQFFNWYIKNQSPVEIKKVNNICRGIQLNLKHEYLYRNHCKIPQWYSVLETLKMRKCDSTKLNIHRECFSEKCPQIFQQLIPRMSLNECLCRYSKDHEFNRTPISLQLR